MQKIKTLLVSLLIFLFPIFFLTTTQEFFFTNKFYLLGFGVLLLLLLTVIEYILSKKFVWKKTPFDTVMIVFVIFYGASILFSSPNKIQALLNPVTGFVTVLSLTILYFVIIQSKKQIRSLVILSWSALAVAVLTILSQTNLLTRLNLPANLAFLKSPTFTPLGSPIDLLLFLGFFAITGFIHLVTGGRVKGLPTARNEESTGGKETRTGPVAMIFFVIIVVAFILTAYGIFKPFPSTPNVARQNVVGKTPTSIFQTLPPFSISWYAAVETLKDPKTAFFGVGPDNFAAIYTRVKNTKYNASPLWNVNFTQSRSFILQLWTETGVLGLAAFIFLIFTAFKNSLEISPPTGGSKLEICYLLLALLLFPPTLITLFLLYIALAASGRAEGPPIAFSNKTILFAVALILLATIGSSGYLLGKSYAAEYYFKKSLDGFAKNNVKTIYDNMRKAVVTNPYIERYRVNFSQVNFLIANNVAAKATSDVTKATKLSAQDQQTVGQAIQAAITEAKTTVTLNPNKASAWENLALIYRNLLNAVQGADAWTIASYQRAIIMDPQNPIYRLSLGGVYFALKNYDEASRLFEQAISLKPDWPNAYYNLAWASYQKQDYQKAASAMEVVLKLLENDKQSNEYKKAAAELEQFKKKIPAQEATPSSQLSLPKEPSTKVEPKLQLPKSASPETH